MRGKNKLGREGKKPPKFLPFSHSPDSTFPMTTVPISEYLSTMGIIKGPSNLRFSDGKESRYGMKGCSLKY